MSQPGLDYSKLTEEQLEAISNNDYSKLPDNILNQIINANQVAPGATSRPADPANFNRQAAKDAGYTDEEIDAYLRNPERTETQAGTVRQEVQGLAQALAVPVAQAVNYAIENPLTTAAGAYGAYKGRQLANAAIDRLSARGAVAPQGNFPPAGTPGSPQAPIGSSTGSTTGSAVRQIPINAAPQPVAPTTSPIVDAQGRPIVRPAPQPIAPAAAAGPLPPTLTAGEPPLRPPAQPSVINRATDIVKQLALSKVAPALGAAARVAGPAGLAYSVYEASPYIQQGGQELVSGQAQQRMREAQRAVLNAPTPAPLTAQEAQNLIASGDQRLINIYRNDPQVARLLGAAQTR